MQDYFPLGVAKGQAFCNRVEERRRLSQNIKKCRHTLISSPRRYGKTSLVQKVLENLKLPYQKIDLSMITSQEMIRDYLLSATEQLLIQLQPSYKKAYAMAKQWLSQLKPKLILDEETGPRIELAYQKRDSSLKQINKTLAALDLLAKKSKKNVVIFLDEFQQIATLSQHKAIEAAIRSIAQELENVTLIFSGSNRKLLLMMFDDSQRPFFQLCDRILLQRITSKDYTRHLQKLAKQRWQKQLPQLCLDAIFEKTERHPYYMNLLCHKLWDSKQIPNAVFVDGCWHKCLEEETYLLSQTLMSLSNTQRALLQLIVKQSIAQPTAKATLAALSVSAGAAAKAHEYLVENDYIMQDEEAIYQLINPLLRSYIEKQSLQLKA